MQNSIIMEEDLVFRGPNTDRLDRPEHRLADGCHFSSLGLDKAADMWVEALKMKSSF